MSAPSTNTQSAPGNQSQNNPNGVHSTPGLPEGLNINNISDVTSLPPEQLAALIQSLPGIANIPGLVQKNDKGEDATDAARTLSNLAAGAGPFGGPGGPAGLPFPPPGVHILPTGLQQGTSNNAQQPSSGGDDGEDDGEDGGDGGGSPPGSGPSGNASGGRRSGRNPQMSNEEWTRQRKDNHKEVERRRRGNINDGINELGRIVPNGTGEKAKGAILQRAVQYIHHLKENEARNIEKWTLEKLLMDQAMGDLQAQLEEMRRLWEEERGNRSRAEGELEVLRGVTGQAAPGAMAGAAIDAATGKRRSREPEAKDGEEKEGKRQKKSD